MMIFGCLYKSKFNTSRVQSMKYQNSSSNGRDGVSSLPPVHIALAVSAPDPVQKTGHDSEKGPNTTLTCAKQILQTVVFLQIGTNTTGLCCWTNRTGSPPSNTHLCVVRLSSVLLFIALLLANISLKVSSRCADVKSETRTTATVWGERKYPGPKT